MKNFNEEYRFGSAAFAGNDEFRQNGLYEIAPSKVLLGFHGQRGLYFGGQGGIATIAGARSGKLRDVLAYSACGHAYWGNAIFLDPKGEIASISQYQLHTGKHSIPWNPLNMHRLGCLRINPVEYIRLDSQTLISDLKATCEALIPRSGSANSEYFELRAREFAEGIALAVVERDGVLTIPAWFEAINLAVEGGDRWLEVGFLMSESRFDLPRRVEAEIFANREGNGSGFRGIMGELLKSFQCFSDNVLLRSVSPPFDFSLFDLLSETERYNLYLIVPAEFLDTWAAAIRLLFTSAMLIKSRAPQAPAQLWCIDEAGQLGAFPMLVKMFTYGAGINIRPWAVFQNIRQMDALGPNARSIVLSSAATRQFFGARDIETAETVSRMLGRETLTYDDTLAQSRAEHARREAVQALLSGGDPLAAGIAMKQARFEAGHRTKQARDLRTPSEILNMPGDRQFIFSDQIDKPIYAERRAYYEQRFMAGLFHPNPYHPPLSHVRVKTRFGMQARRILQSEVPDAYRHLIQYRTRPFTYVEGYKLPR